MKAWHGKKKAGPADAAEALLGSEHSDLRQRRVHYRTVCINGADPFVLGFARPWKILTRLQHATSTKVGDQPDRTITRVRADLSQR